MATSSIDGLVSGLDTTTIVNQLIALERAPADRLAARKSVADARAAAYGVLKSKVDTVKSAFEALDSTTDWFPAKATSSDADAVSVSASAGARPATLSFTVTRLAAAHSVVSGGLAKAADATWSDAEVVLNVDGVDEAITVEPDEDGVRSLHQVAEAVNGAGLGLSAQAVQVSPGQFRLQITAQESGEASRFSVVSGLADGYDMAVEGNDAEIEMAGGLYTATSPTNTFDDLLPNVDVTVKAESTEPITVSVTTDTDAIANRAQALVNAVNGTLSSVKTLTAYDATAKRSSALTGDHSVQRLSQELTRGLVGPVDGTDLIPATLGITVDRDGTIAFDRVKFEEALADNPEAVQGLFVQAEGAPDNMITRLAEVAKGAVETGTGYLLTAQESQRDRVKSFTTQIEDIERRLELSANRMRKQFTAMETALSSMQSQSSWLSSQIAGLYANSG
ncbi:MAG: flagellar filament capping protein FliD [Acidimicrobiia bacterium]|nr:flagellar filament capping protein FliD [Acidimicrobiia bacterium]